MTFKHLIEALLDSKSEINAMNQVFSFQLGLKLQKTNVKAPKIDGTILEIYKIVVSIFFVLDKNSRKVFWKALSINSYQARRSFWDIFSDYI